MASHATPANRTSRNRREFLKSSTVAAGAAVLGQLALHRCAHAAGSDVIRVGLIGCGSRGPGAVVNALTVDRGARLVAMADVFPDKVQSRREMLRKEKPEQVAVDDAHCFSGLDAYRHVIECSDVVLVACAAKYHSYYLRAAVEAGKHVFVEKPNAIDPVGCREVAAACELAKQKNVSVMSGLQSRHDPAYQETIKRIHDGAIGEIVAIEENFCRGPYNIVNYDPKNSEVEWQFRAQMHFAWLSGDDVTQSLVHNLDRASWVMREQMPVKARGLGGRSASFGRIYGNTFDHHTVIYEYANGVRLYAHCRTQNGCWSDSGSYYWGTKGRCCLAAHRIEGQNAWHYQGHGGNPYDIEHRVLFSAIRSGKAVNCGNHVPGSTTMTVMGQLACYAGREISWEQISKSNFSFLPKIQDVRLDMAPPVTPDAAGNYPVPMPGITEFAI